MNARTTSVAQNTLAGTTPDLSHRRAAGTAGRLGPAVVLCAILWMSPAVAADWKFPRGDAAASGATDVQLPEQIDVGWEFRAKDAVESTPIISGDRVYLADVAGNLYALDRKNGNPIWQKSYDTGFLVSPVFADERIVITDWDGKIYLLSADDGSEQWTRETESEINGSPTIHDGRVLVASSDAKLYCLRLDTGEPEWTYEAEDQIQCSPTIAGDRTFLGGCDGKLHIIDLKTGKRAGETLPLDGPTGSTPAIRDQVAIVPTYGGCVFAFDWKNQKQLWKYEDFEQGQEYQSSAAIMNDTVVVVSERKQVDALNAGSGKRLWRKTLRRTAGSSPVIAGEDVWIAESKGRLLRLALSDGSEKWSYEVRGDFLGGIAISDSELIIADDDGVVRCFRGAANQ